MEHDYADVYPTDIQRNRRRIERTLSTWRVSSLEAVQVLQATASGSVNRLQELPGVRRLISCSCPGAIRFIDSSDCVSRRHFMEALNAKMFDILHAASKEAEEASAGASTEGETGAPHHEYAVGGLSHQP